MPAPAHPLPESRTPPMAPEGEPWFGLEDAPALRDFFAIYEVHVNVQEIFRHAAAIEPAFADALGAMSPSFREDLAAEKRGLLRRAIARDWGPYARDLSREGALYASSGVRHWHAVTRVVARIVTPHLVAAYEAEPRRLADALTVMHSFLDGVRATIGDAFVARREAMLREVEVRAQRLIASSMVGVWVFDASGVTVFVNDRITRILGVDARDARGAPATRFLDADAGAQLLDRLARRGGAVTGSFEQLLRRADGTAAWALFETSPLFDPSGAFEGTLAMVTDVTERRAAEALRAENVALEAFSSAAAHDLRAPLRAIGGFTRALGEDYAAVLGEEGAGYVGRILENTRRMDRLIEALLSLARVTRTVIHPHRTDLSALAHDAIAELRAADPGRSVEAVVEGGLVAFVDPTLARTLIANLVGNAWKFTGKADAARVEIGREGPAFFVRDNGAGFEMARASGLFTPFERLHGASDFPGTGLGLATSQRIVERHGGRIWANARPGEGATFWFSVPDETRAPAGLGTAAGSP